MGCPLLLGSQLDKEVQAYLQNFRKICCPVNTAVTIGAATGLVHTKDSNLLAVNGGPIVATQLTRRWAQYLLNLMDYVKRKASSTASDSGGFRRYESTVSVRYPSLHYV